jgi:DNA-binding HxlR family transcriptional regulator
MVAVGYGTQVERAGAHALRLLAAPFTAPILDELARGSRRPAELRRQIGSPPRTALRARLGQLSDVGAVEKRRLHPFPSVREHVLANGPGTELRFVAATLAGWLAGAPGGSLELGDEPARDAVQALVEGWSTGILRIVAERPVTLDELNAAVDGGLSLPSLRRSVSALREAGLLEVGGEDGQAGSYRVNEWLREATAPLVTAIRWERKHLPAATRPVGPDDAEAGLLLAMPLLRLPAEISGSCRLGVEFGDGAERRFAGVSVEVERGEVVSCHPSLDGDPAAFASGPATAWQRVAIEAQPDRLELGGDTRLARALLDCLNQTLFPPRLL